jgi:hypothetical protein
MKDKIIIQFSMAKLAPYVKGKAIPVQAWRVPEGSRKLKHPDFKTFGS